MYENLHFGFHESHLNPINSFDSPTNIALFRYQFQLQYNN